MLIISFGYKITREYQATIVRGLVAKGVEPIATKMSDLYDTDKILYNSENNTVSVMKETLTIDKYEERRIIHIPNSENREQYIDFISILVDFHTKSKNIEE